MATVLNDLSLSLENGRGFYLNERKGAWTKDITASGRFNPAGDLGRRLVSLYCTQFPHAQDAAELMGLFAPARACETPNASISQSFSLDRADVASAEHREGRGHDECR